jgi:hypothetical protein
VRLFSALPRSTRWAGSTSWTPQGGRVTVLSSIYQSTARLLLSTLYEPLPKHLISVLGVEACRDVQQCACGRGYLCAADVSSFCTLADGVIVQMICCTNNGRILLANLLQRSRSTFSRRSFLSFFAFHEGMWDTPIAALGGWPTVSGRLSGDGRELPEAVVTFSHVELRS